MPDSIGYGAGMTLKTQIAASQAEEPTCRAAKSFVSRFNPNIGGNGPAKRNCRAYTEKMMFVLLKRHHHIQAYQCPKGRRPARGGGTPPIISCSYVGCGAGAFYVCASLSYDVFFFYHKA